jgi:DNA-binding NtrC family response regulator
MAQKSKVLVIDDEETITRILAKMLAKDYEVHVANNGKSALQLIQTHVFDAIIVDLVMPEMDGHEVIQRVSRVDPDIPNIVILPQETPQSEFSGICGKTCGGAEKDEIRKEAAHRKTEGKQGEIEAGKLSPL